LIQFVKEKLFIKSKVKC